MRNSRKTRRWVGLLMLGGVLVAVLRVPFMTVSSWADDRTPGHSRAPELRGVQTWLNTDRPLTLAGLKGQVVLLDFWTYCCINCMHIFPDLQYLEEKYRAEPFVVIGVHSGKFSQEKDPENIRRAILRHNIAHPVAVDSDYAVWNAYGVNSWPSLVLIDPLGHVVGQVSGEGHRQALDSAIGDLLAEHRRRGTLAAPLTFGGERAAFQGGVLEFPGKVLADADGGRLFISDTNHHRVLVSDLDGRVRQVLGTGQTGLHDGAANSARFHQPQGLALDATGRTLFVADTENHAVRAADLDSGQVRTLAGTGEQSYDYRADGPGARTALSSPWDLIRVGQRLYIAMAGTHQIWVLDLSSGRVSVFAGTGREDRIDGPRQRAAFAQPSGLATDGRRLYVADSEISTIRVIELEGDGDVRTVAGSGGLFEFGQRDGIGAVARFQHPLGVALHGDKLFVADTFNSSIRVIDLDNRAVSTWFGGSAPASAPENALDLAEPGGLSLGGSTLYVADTNHHRILAIDATTRQARIVPIVLPEAAPAH